MSQLDDEFIQRLRATFIVEADEHVQAMSADMLKLEKLPPSEIKPEEIEMIFRHAHSLKGAARATNSGEIEAVCQSLETVFAEWKRQQIRLEAEDFDTLHHAIDLIGKLVPVTSSQLSRENEQGISLVLRQLAQLASGESTSPPAQIGRNIETSVATATDTAGPPPRPETAGPPTSQTAVMAPRLLAETIRISTAKLDRLVLNTEEMVAVKQNAAQRAADLRPFDALFTQWATRWARIQPQLRELRGGGATLSAPASAMLGEFIDWNFGYIKSFEGKLRALTRAVAQDHHDVAKRVDDLLAESKQLVMLPFSTLSDFFPKLVRDLSRTQGKEVVLVVRGADVEIDKRILEEMKDALIHLVRNGIDHGIETPDRRALQAKPAHSTLTVAAATIDGNKLEIVVSDDGGGIDLERVKQSAIKRGFLTAAEAPTWDDRRVLDLIFQSDISTSPIITEISGRGLGLAIVREKTDKLGGRVVVETRPGAGTTFRIKLPVTLAALRGIVVKVAGSLFVVPTAHVERVARVRSADTKTVENERRSRWIIGRCRSCDLTRSWNFRGRLTPPLQLTFSRSC